MKFPAAHYDKITGKTRSKADPKPKAETRPGGGARAPFKKKTAPAITTSLAVTRPAGVIVTVDALASDIVDGVTATALTADGVWRPESSLSYGAILKAVISKLQDKL